MLLSLDQATEERLQLAGVPVGPSLYASLKRDRNIYQGISLKQWRIVSDQHLSVMNVLIRHLVSELSIIFAIFPPCFQHTF